MSTGRQRLSELLRAPAYAQFKDWHSSGAEEPEKPQRARGALSQAQLREAERYALKFGLGLPDPRNANARQSTLRLIWLDMQQAGVSAPSVAGDAGADARKAAA